MSRIHFLKKVWEKTIKIRTLLHCVGKKYRKNIFLRLHEIFWDKIFQKKVDFHFFGLDNKWITKVAKSSSCFFVKNVSLKMIIVLFIKMLKFVTSQCKWITMDNKSSKSSSLDIYLEHKSRCCKIALL